MAARGIPVNGRKLEHARMARRLSAAQLAEMVGCTRAHIRLMEREERVPSIELLGRLEVALGVSADELEADVPPRREMPAAS